MNIIELKKYCELTLKKANIQFYEEETSILLDYSLNISRKDIVMNSANSVSESDVAKITEQLNQRILGEPLQYVIGKWNFYGYDFFIGKGVLIPRDDTEVVVNLCINYLQNNTSKTVVDLCAGSGAISVALQKTVGANVTAIELYDDAFSYLTKNIEYNNSNVTPIKADVFNCYEKFLDNSIDLIVSNPPYIKTDEICTLQSEVLYEPSTALDGGADGLQFYKDIIINWSKKLKPLGALAFEIGEEQAEIIKQMMIKNGFEQIKIDNDLGNIPRAIIGIKKK